LQRQPKELLLAEAANMSRLLMAYRNVINRLKPYVKAVENKLTATPTITAKAIQRTDEYVDLLRAAVDQVQQFSRYNITELGITQLAAFELAVRHLRDLERYLGATVKIVTPDAITILRDMLAPGSKLYSRIELWAPNTADQVAKAIIEGVQLGKNPRVTAAAIEKALGSGLNDAMRTTRTVQLYSYREATRYNYIANADIIEGWIWFAALDDRTCMSCIAMDGSVHPLSEPLNDHYNGRCAMLPYPIGQAAYVDIRQGGDGKTWFNEQGADVQTRMMGKGAFDAWKGGLIQLEQLTREVPDEVYGSMRSVTPLGDILNE